MAASCMRCSLHGVPTHAPTTQGRPQAPCKLQLEPHCLQQRPCRPQSVCSATTVSSSSAPATPSTSGSSLISVRNLSFHPPGAPAPLLDNINMEVPPNSMGLIIGRSGSGKTTLLQVLAGLCEQTSGSIHINPRARAPQAATSPTSTSTRSSNSSDGRGSKFAARMAAENRPVRSPSPSPPPTTNAAPRQLPGTAMPLAPASTLEQRMSKVGLVFQFPERHFLGSDVFSELTFSWPRDPQFFMEQQALKARVLRVLQAVRLSEVDMRMAPWDLSGGQQRRLALAIQLIRQPSLLLLDEPLAGLDWQARQEIVELLLRLKQECSLVVVSDIDTQHNQVSHDLREVAPLVDCAWTMQQGGKLEQLPSWPPPGGLDVLTTPSQ